MATPSPLSLLESADALIRKAEEQLQTLKGMGLNLDLEARLAPVIAKQTQVEREIRTRKLEILKVLVRMRAPIKPEMQYRCTPRENQLYVLDGSVPGAEVIRIGPANQRLPGGPVCAETYTLEQFVDRRDPNFFGYCEVMLANIGEFLGTGPARRDAEIAQLRDLLHRIAQRTS